MKKWIIRLVVIIIAAGIGLAGVKLYKTITTPQKVHYHAGFVVFDNNRKVDFSNAKYMNVSPCTLQSSEEENVSASDIQKEKAHLHDFDGEDVHVERSGAKWSDLFTNLNYSINYSSATGYINGKVVQNFQEQSINPYDSLVVFIGKNNISQDLKQGVTKAHIQEAAKKSVDCG